MVSQKLFVVGVDTYASKNLIGGINPPIILLASLFSAPWLSRQVQVI
jgi:hypothetical protein